MTQRDVVPFAPRDGGGQSRPASRDRSLSRFASIGLTLAALVCAAPSMSAAQQGTISGTVVVEGAQRPLPGVQISVQGQEGREAVSDASGRFRISGLTGTTVTLNARVLGFRPASQSVTVGSTNVRFVLSERAVELNQVVVTGTAGGEQLRTLGTSVATVNVADVASKTALPSMDALINGRTPGVVVLPGTGQIGSGANIRIRGMGTFSLSSQPLIYVDGIRVNNSTGTGISVQAFGSGIVSRLNDFDPTEIENIEVLKGPAAATLYGTEAARGVINIITKKGSAGGTKYSFQVQGGSNWFQDAEGRIPTNYCVQPTPTQCVNANSAAGPLLGLNVITQEEARGTPLFRTGDIRDYSANVSGGTPAFRFFASGDLSHNQGAERNNERRQTSVRTNLSITPNTKVDIGTSVGYINSRTTLSCEGGCGGAMWESMYSNPANLPQFCGTDVGCTYVRGFQSTPPEAFYAPHFAQHLDRLTASATIQYRPFSWMSHRLEIGTDLTMDDNPEGLPFLTSDTAAFFFGDFAKGYRYHNQHQATFNTYDYTGSANFNLRPSLTSKTSFGVQYYTREDQFIQGEGDFFPAPGLETIGSAGTKVGLTDGWSANNTLGYYLQQQVGWKDRLFVTAAARVDNNSSFGKEVKWVGYPKGSISYVASEEPSIQKRLPSFVNSLRLRGAYGASGQQPALNTALQTLSPAPGPNGQGILTPASLGNQDLKPERVEGLELGFETGMFSDRVGIDFTYFRDKSKDAILSRGVAPSSGFGSQNQWFNAGEITKQGVELGLKAQILNARDYAWDVNFTLGTHSSKIDQLNGRDTTIDLGSASHRIGYAPFDWFSYKILSAEYNPTTRRAINPICDNGRGAPMPCFAANGTTIQAPKVFLGHSIPKAQGSLTSTVRFLKSFSVYGMFDYAANYKRLDNNLRIRCQIFYTCAEYLQPDKADPRRLVQMQSNGTLRDFVINNSRYVKFREISLSYDAPERYAARVAAKQLGMTVSARNLHTWTPYTGLDPESEFVAGTPINVDQAHVPQLTALVFTLRLSY